MIIYGSVERGCEVGWCLAASGLTGYTRCTGQNRQTFSPSEKPGLGLHAIRPRVESLSESDEQSREEERASERVSE